MRLIRCRLPLYLIASALIFGATAGGSAEASAILALSSFAQEVANKPAAANRKVDDQAISALQDSRSGWALAQPLSIKALQADNIFDQPIESAKGGQSAPATDAPKSCFSFLSFHFVATRLRVPAAELFHPDRA